MGEGEPISAARRAMRRFLHQECTGCHFVPGVIGAGSGVAWATIGNEVPYEAALTGVFTLAEQNALFAAALFPAIRDHSDLDAMLAAVAKGKRWRLDFTQEAIGGRPMRVASLFWIKQDGDEVSALGMAPMLSMPVTRRAPYVSIFAWTGKRSQRKRKNPDPFIGIGDTPAIWAGDKLSEMLQKSKRATKELNGTMLPKTATFILESAPQ